MKRVILVLSTVALMACARHAVDTTTTTSATVPAAPVWSPSSQPESSQMPFDLPKDIMRAPHEVHHVRDAQISAAIHTGIVSHPDLAASAKDIDVTTLDGLVTLRGVVHTRRDRDELDRLARSAPGVKHVDNRVRVVP